MKHWAIIFLLLMMLAAPFGFGGIDPSAEPVARILFGFFAAMFLVSILVWIARDRN